MSELLREGENLREEGQESNTGRASANEHSYGDTSGNQVGHNFLLEVVAVVFGGAHDTEHVTDGLVRGAGVHAHKAHPLGSAFSAGGLGGDLPPGPVAGRVVSLRYPVFECTCLAEALDDVVEDGNLANDGGCVIKSNILRIFGNDLCKGGSVCQSADDSGSRAASRCINGCGNGRCDVYGSICIYGGRDLPSHF